MSKCTNVVCPSPESAKLFLEKTGRSGGLLPSIIIGLKLGSQPT
jgi:hypothetical protein